MQTIAHVIEKLPQPKLVSSHSLRFDHGRGATRMAFLGQIPSIFVEAVLTCLSAIDLALEIYDILDPLVGPKGRRRLG